MLEYSKGSQEHVNWQRASIPAAMVLTHIEIIYNNYFPKGVASIFVYIESQGKRGLYFWYNF